MRILVSVVNFKGRILSVNFVFCITCLFLADINGFSQVERYQNKIYFISDIQSPLLIEELILKAFKNEEARDCLFADIIIHQPLNLLLLGDLTSRGSREKAWIPLDNFLNSLKTIDTKVYAIPGNHEYMSASSDGIKKFEHRFQKGWLSGYVINIDSIAIVMLNSNLTNLTKDELAKQLMWYKSSIISLDSDSAVKAIIVCTHHAPYSNSKIVGSSEQVEKLIIPAFEESQKSKLFISGHSHNLEYFSDSVGKHFLVIGGGGGLTQPLVRDKKRKYHDLLEQDMKPLYFYLIIERNRNNLKLIARGFKKDFIFFESEIGVIPLI